MINSGNEGSNSTHPYLKYPIKPAQVNIELHYDNIPSSYGRPKTNNPFQKYPLYLKTRRLPLPPEDSQSINSLCNLNESVRDINISSGEVKNHNVTIIHRRQQQSSYQEKKIRSACNKKHESNNILVQKMVILPGITCKAVHRPNISMVKYNKKNESIPIIPPKHGRRGSLENNIHKYDLIYKNNEAELRFQKPRYSNDHSKKGEEKKFDYTLAFNKLIKSPGDIIKQTRPLIVKSGLRHRVNEELSKSHLVEPGNSEEQEKHGEFADKVKKYINKIIF